MVVSMSRWCGKVAVISGASSGIGAAIATALINHGVNVVGLARRSEEVEKLAKKLSTQKGKLYAVKTDMTKEEDIIKAFEWTTKNVGPVHILVNNAGITKNGNLTDGKTEDWKAVLDVNVMGLCIATREAVKIMKANNINGHIVHINSITGHQVVNLPNLNVYAASKFAVTALVETLRQEFNQLNLKIKITSISPGLVETEMTTFNKDITDEVRATISQAPILKSQDIADGVMYVLSTPEHVQVHELTIRPIGEKI